MLDSVYYTGSRLNPEEHTCSDVKVLRFERPPGAIRLPITRRLKHYPLHSPTGMNWGYGGSGPADCALALLMDAFGESLTLDELRHGGKECASCAANDGGGWREDCQTCHGFGRIESRAFRLHQDFKFAFVARWGDSWNISKQEILEWAAAQDAVRTAARDAQFHTRGTE